MQKIIENKTRPMIGQSNGHPICHNIGRLPRHMAQTRTMPQYMGTVINQQSSHFTSHNGNVSNCGNFADIRELDSDFHRIIEERKQLDTEILTPNFYQPLFQDLTQQQHSHQQPSLTEIKLVQIEDKNSNVSEWPELTIDEINASFISIINMKQGYKLKISDRKILMIDDSYLYIFRSEKNGQSRNSIVSFLDHLLKQTIVVVNKIITVMKYDHMSGLDSQLSKLMHNMSTFIHHFDKIKNCYKNDNTICVKLEVMYHNYVNCHTVIFQKFSS